MDTRSDWQKAINPDNLPAFSEIIDTEEGLPILVPAPWYQMYLDRINSRPKKYDPRDNFTADDLDRKCTEVHEYNESVRKGF